MADALTESFTPNGQISPRVELGLVIATVVAMVAAWACRPNFLPGFQEIAEAYPGLLSDGLVADLWVSVMTNLQAILISTLIALPLSYLTVLPAARPLVRVIAKLRFLGMSGLVILFTLIFGGGHALKVAILVFGMTCFLVTSLYDVVEGISQDEFDHASTLRMGPWRAVLEIVVLGKFDVMLDAIRQNAAMGWVMLTLVEGLVRFEGGMGAVMLTEDKHLRLASVFAVQILVPIIGLGQDWGLRSLRKSLCPYAYFGLVRR